MSRSSPNDAGPAAWQPIDNVWEYDPAADSWKALAPMPTKRGAAVAAGLDSLSTHDPNHKALVYLDERALGHLPGDFDKIERGKDPNRPDE